MAESIPPADHDENTPERGAARLDPAHEVRPAGAKAPARQPVAATEGGESKRPLPLEAQDAVALHASNLADRLAEQQAKLDRRAEDLAAQEADIENKLQTARAWFDEQHTALDDRAAGLEQREANLDLPPAPDPAEVDSEQFAQLAEREQKLDARQAELYDQIDRLTADRAKLADRETQLNNRQAEMDRLWEELSNQREAAAIAARANKLREAELEREGNELEAAREEIANQEADAAARESKLAARRAEIEAAIKRFEGLGVAEERIAELSSRAEEYEARARYLDEAEAMLAEEKQAVAADRREVERSRQQAEERFVLERRRIEAERAELRKLTSQHEQTMAAKEAELDQRHSALTQLQSELEAGQREVLEMRLATEETWAQLAGALAPATLTRSISQVRSRLADHYQHTLQEIADRRGELTGIASQLASEHQRVDEQRAKLQQWAARREEDIEQRAARLIARERELDRQQRHYELLEERWASERREYRDRIMRLLAEVRDAEQQPSDIRHAA